LRVARVLRSAHTTVGKDAGPSAQARHQTRPRTVSSLALAAAAVVRAAPRARVPVDEIVAAAHGPPSQAAMGC
jgi:hypothetical protein